MTEQAPRLTPAQAVGLALTRVGLGLLCRALDVAVLVLRPSLWRAYAALVWAEALDSPYRWPSGFETALRLRQSGQTIRELMYGELPVFSGVWVFWRAGVRAGSHVLDLGAGRGRGLFAAKWLGAGVRGVELRPEHVGRMQAALSRAGMALEEGDVLQTALGNPTHVLVNWCAFSQTTQAALTARLARLPKGTRVVAVTRPVEDEAFATRSSHRVLFTWGTERVWVHERL